MIEAFTLPFLRQALPVELSGLKKRKSTHHIGLREGERILYRAVDMGLGCKMDDAVDMLVADEFVYSVEIADIGLDKLVVGLAFDIFEIGKVARIGKLVEIDYLVFGILIDKKPDYMASYESGSAGYDNCSFHNDRKEG
jgi:hypothetical protein